MLMNPNWLRKKIVNPKDTVKILDKYIIGQEDAKKTLALMLFQRQLLLLKRHYHFLTSVGTSEDIDLNLDKSNVLLFGSTGSGKTALMRTIGKILGCVVTVFDVSGVTGSGWHGDDVNNILRTHYANCKSYQETMGESDSFLALPTGYDEKTNTMDTYESAMHRLTEQPSDIIELFETGIIYLDEIDKLRIDRIGSSSGHGDGVQSELLKILEGQEIEVNVADSKFSSNNTQLITFNLKDLIFVGGGAFSGLSEIIKKRLHGQSGIGFAGELTDKKKIEESFKHMITKDLVDYGMKPELLGRFPLRSILRTLTKEDMMRIITEPQGSVFDQYAGLFRLFGIDLEIEPKALELIAERALEQKTGARAIKGIMDVILQEVLFNIYDIVEETFVITEELVRSRV